MLALGVLDEVESAGLFTADPVEPIRPGKDAQLLPTLSRSKSIVSVDELIAESVHAGVTRELRRVKNLAETNPSSTTLAALAQAYAALDERDGALAAACAALKLGIRQTESDGEPRLADPISSRVAAEVMARFGGAEVAYTLLHSAVLPQSLRLTQAVLAVELGRFDEAMVVLHGQDGALVESFRGFLYAAQGEFQRAIPHLRRALREFPDDADAAMNLSVSLWQIGSRRKAVAAALRATRTAPGRQDLSIRYLDLLLEVGDVQRASVEIATLNARSVVADARFLVVQARVLLAMGEPGRALSLLDRAVTLAGQEGNVSLRVEIAANIAALRFRLGRQTHDQAIATLSALARDYPEHEAVVVNFARSSVYMRDAPALRRAVERSGGRASAISRAFLRHQVALLEGDNEAAGAAAAEWFDLDRLNPWAATTAIVALGIGLERWKEAEVIASFAIAQFPSDPTVVNNAAYVLAMVGRAPEAIKLLEPWADSGFVPKATLGLAHLANGNISQGMRLYREAADQAEKENRDWRSLMTTYQALVVRQLGLDKHERPQAVTAQALVEFPLPPDWDDQPDFVRLHNLCKRRGYDWPLTV